MVFHWSLSDNKFPQVSRTLLSILTDISNIHSYYYFQVLKSFNQYLVTPRKAPITIGPTVNFTFHNFLNSRARSTFLSLFSHSFNFTLWSTGVAKFTLFCWLLWDLVVWPKFVDPFVCQNPRGVCVTHSLGLMLGCAYTICSYRQTSTSCTIPSGSPCSPSHA